MKKTKKIIHLSIVLSVILISLSGCKSELDTITALGEIIGQSVVNGVNDLADKAGKAVSNLSYNPRAEANDMLEDLLVALENNDNEAIKAMFAWDLITSNGKIDEEIQNAVDFFDGKVVSYDYVGTPASGEKYRDGEIAYARIGSAVSESIVTDVDTYRISFSAVIINKKKSTQEGIWRIWIRNSDDVRIQIGSDDYDL